MNPASTSWVDVVWQAHGCVAPSLGVCRTYGKSTLFLLDLRDILEYRISNKNKSLQQKSDGLLGRTGSVYSRTTFKDAAYSRTPSVVERRLLLGLAERTGVGRPRPQLSASLVPN